MWNEFAIFHGKTQAFTIKKIVWSQSFFPNVFFPTLLVYLYASMHVFICILGLYYGIYTYKFGFVKVLKKGEKKLNIQIVISFITFKFSSICILF